MLTLANESRARNKVIVLDSCHSGIAGPTHRSSVRRTIGRDDRLDGINIGAVRNGENGSGVFTTLFVDALNGAAGNLVGDVTPGSVYAHIDQSLGPWEQRPVFKTNVKSFVSLRKVQAPIDLTDLHRIAELFPSAGFEFSLDPSYEPESDNPDPKNTAVFAILQKYNRVNLAIPLEARHMYHAAMESKACKLTVLGEHYRRLVTRNRI